MSDLSVLIVSWYPASQPDSGERVRLHALAHGLSAGADVTVLSFSGDRPREEEAGYRDIRSRVAVPYVYRSRHRVAALVGRASVHEVVLPARQGQRDVELELTVRKPDVVVVNQLPPWPLVPRSYRSRTAVDTHNAEGLRLQRMLVDAPATLRLPLQQQLRAAGRLETAIAQQAGQVWCVSNEDSAYFEGLGAHTQVVPNGVDLPVTTWAALGSADRPLRLLFLGSLSYNANVHGLRWFRDELSSANGPAWTLDIVGSGDPDPVRQLFDNDPRVTVVGRVEEVGPSYLGHDALIVPLLRGGGSRLKVLEGLGHGIPILSTAIGVEGVSLQPGRDYLAIERADEFAGALRQLREPGVALALSEAGRVVAETHQWANICTASLARLRELAGSAG
jgi:polysaccharide biosynthesis protein PslH